jgi:hypothetical protein
MFTTTLRYRRIAGRGVGHGRLCFLSAVVSALLIGTPAAAWAKGHGGPTPTCAHNTCTKMQNPAKPPHGADAGGPAIETSGSAPRSESSGGRPQP